MSVPEVIMREFPQSNSLGGIQLADVHGLGGLRRLLEDVPLHDRKSMWFQHSSTPLHVFMQSTCNWLNNHFPDTRINRGGSIVPQSEPTLFLMELHQENVYATEVLSVFFLFGRCQQDAQLTQSCPSTEIRIEGWEWVTAGTQLQCITLVPYHNAAANNVPLLPSTFILARNTDDQINRNLATATDTTGLRV
jgi:hypothetical protein